MKNNVKIFVSNRIGIKSYRIPNSIYIPVLCGAVYKDINSNYNIQGDNVGVNISKKRNNFCEFTVEYWAWKNTVSDYIGLCHYHRYLSFAKKRYRTNLEGMVIEFILSDTTIRKYSLIDEQLIEEFVSSYDVVVNESVNVCTLPTPHGRAKSVRDFWGKYTGVYFDVSLIDTLLQIIKIRYPQIYPSAINYLDGSQHRGYNCYVMKRNIYNEFCEFQFSILFELESNLDKKSLFLKKFPRTLAYIGEILYGIYIYHIKNKGANIKEVQLVYFEHTSKTTNIILAYLLFLIKKYIESLLYCIFPKASRRRLVLKRLYFKLTQS